MSSILNCVYSYVFKLDLIISKCVCNQFELSDEFKRFCGKTILTSNINVDINYNNILVSSKPCTDSLTHIKHQYIQQFYSKTGKYKDMIPKEDAIDYLNNHVFNELHALLGDYHITVILNNCSVFEQIDANVYHQKLGKSISNYAWNSVPLNNKLANNNKHFNCYAKTVQQICKQFIVTNTETVIQVNSCTKQTNLIIDRKSILYSRQTSGKISNTLVLTKNIIEVTDLFKDIFCAELRNHFTTNSKQKLWPLLHNVITRHKSCEFDKLLKSKCAIECGYFEKHDYQLRYALELYSTHKQVLNYLYSILYYIFPVSLFGSKSNFNKLYANIKLLITSGLNTVLYISNFIYNLDFTCCEWFQDFIGSENEIQIRNAFISWIIKYLLIILKAKFYVTETSNNKSCLFFYRFDLWQKMKSRAISQFLILNIYEQIDINQITHLIPADKSKLLTLSSLRFVPKFNGFRAINQLKPRVKNEIKEMKSTLATILVVLKTLRLNLCKNSHNRNHFYETLKNLKNKKFDELYYIRADIADCYPSIDQLKMYNIIEKLIQTISYDNNITIKEFDCVTKTIHKLFSKHIRYVKTENIEISDVFLKQNNGKTRECVINSRHYEKTYKTYEILCQIKTYVQNAIIKTGKHTYYKLKSGIRQGGMLSSELCSIYITSLVEHYFNDFGLLTDELRVIQVDDFLFVTPSIQRAKSIIQIMLNGFKDYNLKINFNKIQLNFHFSGEMNEYRTENNPVFYGHCIDFRSLTMFCDYSIYEDQCISYTFNCNPFSSLQHILLLLLRQISLHTSYILLDEDINGTDVVAQNIFERALLQSYRLSAFIILSPKWRTKQNVKFILNFIVKIANRIYRLATNWNNSGKIKFTLSLHDVTWITANAVRILWTKGKIQHRFNERKAVFNFIDELNKKVSQQKKLRYLKFILNYSKTTTFSRILLPYI